MKWAQKKGREKRVVHACVVLAPMGVGRVGPKIKPCSHDRTVRLAWPGLPVGTNRQTGLQGASEVRLIVLAPKRPRVVYLDIPYMGL